MENNYAKLATPRIESLEVETYRALRRLEFAGRTPITLLPGPNASGKSTAFRWLQVSATSIRRTERKGSEMLNQSVIEQAAQRLTAAARSPLKVILFGSYARGDAREDSDRDLLMVEKEVPDPTDEYLRLREELGPLGVGVDLLIYPEAEFEKRRDWCSAPVYWAVREGKVLYESPA